MDIVTRQQAEAYITSMGHDLPSTGVSPDVISDVSARMARYTGRDDWGPEQSRTEYLNGNTQFLIPKFSPIVSVAGIWDDQDHVWGSDTQIDVTDYWLDQNKLGVIHFEYALLMPGYQNIKLTYTGGYAASTNIPSEIQRAAMMQIDYETQSRIPGRFKTINGDMDVGNMDLAEGLGLLGDARILLQPYIRRIPFA